MSDNKIPQNEIQIELTEETGQGIYSNLAVISHSSSEFVMDFIRVLPGMPKAKVQSRIVMTPENAKRLLYTLQDNLQKFEEQYGNISTSRVQGGLLSMGALKGEA